jgi:AraC-like DNA-binding protein
MQTTGRGRILLWRGGSIWIGRAEQPTDVHSHHAIQISLALSDGNLHFREADNVWKDFAAAVIPAHCPHAFKASGQLVANVFVEPESLEGQKIRERFSDGIVSLSGGIGRPGIEALALMYKERRSDEELIACARDVINELAATSTCAVRPVDGRIVRAIELLHEQLGQAINLSDIANSVHLSPERFRHLFIEQTGLRFRPYILWLRLGNALSAYAAGANLTDASYAGGFADSAHFSRTFKRMFGAAPISIKPE